MQRILDLGCGKNKQPGAYGVDLHSDDADIKFNLDTLPWELPDDHFLVVYMLQSLEHLANSVEVMQELYRICQHGALVFIQVPNGCCSGYVQDPDHKTPWNLGSFLYFCEDTQWPPGWDARYIDYDTDFRILHYHIEEHPGKTPWGTSLHKDNLTVVLQVIKEEASDG